MLIEQKMPCKNVNVIVGIVRDLLQMNLNSFKVKYGNPWGTKAGCYLLYKEVRFWRFFKKRIQVGELIYYPEFKGITTKIYQSKSPYTLPLINELKGFEADMRQDGYLEPWYQFRVEVGTKD